MSAPDLDAIRARLDAATPGPWHWAGNVDSGEPYLATWRPGLGRCSVMAIGSEPRSTTGRAADVVRSHAAEFELGDPDDVVDDWAHDRYGEPVTDPRLWFFTDGLADPARDHVQYEVAPEASDRDDARVYRADITDIRHPDAALIAHAPKDIAALLAEVERLRAGITQAVNDAHEIAHASGPCTGTTCAGCRVGRLEYGLRSLLNPHPKETDR